ncbi:MAG: VOC family protein [Actinomycetota bacterium]
MGIPVQVTFDCADPERMAEFWTIALDYKGEDPPEGFETWEDALRAWQIPEANWNDMNAVVDPQGGGPRLLFQKVPEPKTVKNRVHLDVNVGGPHGTSLEDRTPRVDAHAAKLTAAGATILRDVEERGERWIVMADPEGNEFCLQ